MPTHCSPGGRTPPVPREAPAPTPLAVDSTADIPVKRAREVDEEGEKRSGKMSPRITKACTAVKMKCMPTDPPIPGFDESASQSTPIAEQLALAEQLASAKATLRSRSFSGAPIVRFPMRMPGVETVAVPALLLENIITSSDVKVLFDLYFNFCHHSAPVLDLDLHTPSYTAHFAPFLFTCICTVASRYLPDRPGLYAKCRAKAIRLTADSLFFGQSTISVAQGCMILSHWNQPGYANEGDRAYLFSGAALRISLELGLHVKSEPVVTDSADLNLTNQKDVRNRERTWLLGVMTDWSLSLQLGKSSPARGGYLMQHSMEWSSHPLATSQDAAFSFIVDLHAIIAQAIEAFYSDGNSFSGASASIDHVSILRVFLAQMDHWHYSTLEFFQTSPHVGLIDYRVTGQVHRLLMAGSRVPNLSHTDFANYYYRIFCLSFAIQHTQNRPHLASSMSAFVIKGFECAVKFIEIVTTGLGDTGLLRYGSDSTFIYISYVGSFMLKLIRPAFSSLVDPAIALSYARDTAALLENAAVDETHTPAVYATFLRCLIASKSAGERTVAATRAGSRSGSPIVADHELDDLTASLQDILEANAAEDAALAFSLTNDALTDGGYWENMLMPGFGGQMGALSGGAAMLSDNAHFDGWGDLAASSLFSGDDYQ